MLFDWEVELLKNLMELVETGEGVMVGRGGFLGVEGGRWWRVSGEITIQIVRGVGGVGREFGHSGRTSV